MRPPSDVHGEGVPPGQVPPPPTVVLVETGTLVTLLELDGKGVAGTLEPVDEGDGAMTAARVAELDCDGAAASRVGV